MCNCTLARRFVSAVSDFKKGLYKLCSYVSNIVAENSHRVFVHMYTEHIGHAIEQVVSHRCLTNPTAKYVWFVVGKVALGLVFLWVFWFFFHCHSTNFRYVSSIYQQCYFEWYNIRIITLRCTSFAKFTGCIKIHFIWGCCLNVHYLYTPWL